MAAKKAPMKKMAAPAKPAAKKAASKSSSAADFRKADQASMVKYKKSEVKTVDAANKLRKKYGPFTAEDFKGVNRRDFISGFADVVSEGAVGQNPVYMRAAERVASEAWDKKFGKKKK
jgi:hypothetical protein